MNFRPLLICLSLFLLPRLALAYVIPAFPVHQAFPLPMHPTPISVEEAQLLITNNGGRMKVSSQLVLLSKYATTITLEMGSKEIKELSVSSGREVLEVKEMPSGCNGGPSTNRANSRGNCHYEVNVKLPAGVPVTVVSRYQLKGHSGESASSLYGDTLPATFGNNADEQLLAEIGKQTTNYAVTLKGLSRWSQPPKQFRAIIKGQELLKNIRDLSPSGWVFNGQEAVWSWQSKIDNLPALDLAWQTVSPITAQQELAIYARQKNIAVSATNKDWHVMVLKRFHATNQQYQQALDQIYNKATKEAQNTTPANDIRIVIIPEIIANKISLIGLNKTQAIADKYLQTLEEILESLLLEGQELAPCNEAISIVKQLTRPQPNFSEIN